MEILLYEDPLSTVQKTQPSSRNSRHSMVLQSLLKMSTRISVKQNKQNPTIVPVHSDFISQHLISSVTVSSVNDLSSNKHENKTIDFKTELLEKKSLASQ